jgi:ribosomal protein L37AE/L43A
VKGKPMPRSFLYVSAVVIVLCLVVTTAKVTTHSIPAPTCPECGSRNTRLFSDFGNARGFYKCEDCKQGFGGPAQPGFSWTDALEEWLR